MTEQIDLEGRLAAALSRLADAATQIPSKAESHEAQFAVENLTTQLAQERTTNEDLVERVTALKERQETQVAKLETDLSHARQAAEEGAAVQNELKARVEELRDQIARLTEANRAMVGDPQLVNTAMMAELDAMRAARRADVTEIDDIIAQISNGAEGNAHA